MPDDVAEFLAWAERKRAEVAEAATAVLEDLMPGAGLRFEWTTEER